MNWYYVDNGQQAGPVTDEQMAELRRSGKVQDTTLIWREGMPDWKPWIEAPATGVPPVATGGVVCAECGNTFKSDEVIRVNERFVCAACKPVYLQRVREGLAGSGSGGAGPTGTATVEEVIARDYEHDLGDYINRGWELFKSDPGIIIGTSVLVYLCIIAASMMPFGLGYILQYVLSGPLIGGLWVFYLKKLRGEQAAVADGFSGLGPKFGQLLLAYLIPALLAVVCMLPGAIPILFGIVLPSLRHSGGPPFDSSLGIALVFGGGLLLLAGICAAIYLSTCWLFAIPLVADKGISFWPAMSLSRTVVIKHWWLTFLVMLVLSLLGSVGMLACCLGVLVSGPVAFASFAYAYEKLFGDLVRQG
jgi:hypothetical protein